jgi:hypothetical protein
MFVVVTEAQANTQLYHPSSGVKVKEKKSMQCNAARTSWSMPEEIL